MTLNLIIRVIYNIDVWPWPWFEVIKYDVLLICHVVGKQRADLQSMVWFYLMIKINRSLSFSYGNIGSKTINHVDWSHMSILENYNSNKLTTKMKIVYNKAKWWFQANTDRLTCLQWHEFFLLFWVFLFFLHNKNVCSWKINQRQVITHNRQKDRNQFQQTLYFHLL